VLPAEKLGNCKSEGRRRNNAVIPFCVGAVGPDRFGGNRLFWTAPADGSLRRRASHAVESPFNVALAQHPENKNQFPLMAARLSYCLFLEK